MLLMACILHSMCCYDMSYWKMYFFNVALYTVFVILTRDSKVNPKKKQLWIAAYDESSSPKSVIGQDINVENALAYLKELNEQ